MAKLQNLQFFGHGVQADLRVDLRRAVAHLILHGAAGPADVRRHPGAPVHRVELHDLIVSKAVAFHAVLHDVDDRQFFLREFLHVTHPHPALRLVVPFT